jgi:thioesterase domain-containing protein
MVASLARAPRWELAHCLRPGARGAPMFFAARPNQTVGNYADLVAHLDTPRPLWLLQFQYAEETALGRPYAREEFVRWAETYLAAMRRIQPEGRLHVAGACEGTQIAVEIARLVEARGETLAFLGSFDTWPEENTRDPLLERVHQVEIAARGVLSRAPHKARAQLRRLVERLAPDPRPVVPAPPRPKIPRPEQASAGAWAARAAPSGFAPEPIRSKITVFRSRTQPYWRIRDPLCGWASRTTGGVEVHEVEGHHDFVLREPHAPVLAEKLSACLRRLEAEEAHPPTRSV